MSNTVVCLWILVVCVTKALTGSHNRPREELYKSKGSTKIFTPQNTLKVSSDSHSLKTYAEANKKNNSLIKKDILNKTTRRQFIPGLLGRYQQYNNEEYGPDQDQSDESKNIIIIIIDHINHYPHHHQHYLHLYDYHHYFAQKLIRG